MIKLYFLLLPISKWRWKLLREAGLENSHELSDFVFKESMILQSGMSGGLIQADSISWIEKGIYLI